MNIAWIIYESNPEKRKRIQAMNEQLKAKQQLIVNNAGHAILADEILGSNSDFEFSGYLEAIAHFTGEGPFLLVNDTLLLTHWLPGWTKLFKRAQRSPEFFPAATVAGDIRWEEVIIPERPIPYLSSWVFWCNDRQALLHLEHALRKVIAQDMKPPSVVYQNYLDRWFQPSSAFSGWHGELNSNTYHRKLRCVRLEHALSLALAENKPLRSLGELAPNSYWLLRIIDRFRTRWSAWQKRSK